jgi:hypothetical protein
LKKEVIMLWDYLFYSTYNLGRSLWNYDFKGALGQALNFIHCCLNLGKSGEIELNMLDTFLSKFSEKADLHVISIGCDNSLDGSQQVYPWIEKYCQANPQHNVQISLFDPYFFITDRQSGDAFHSFEHKIADPEFVSKVMPGRWISSAKQNIYRHELYDIEVSVYKSFPDWGFETFSKMFLEKYLTPTIIGHINSQDKIVISLHTGGAWISPNLKEMYNNIEDKISIDALKDNLILFGQVGDNPPAQVSQYYDGYEHALEAVPLIRVSEAENYIF